MVLTTRMQLTVRNSPVLWGPQPEGESWLADYQENGFHVFKSQNSKKYSETQIDSIYNKKRSGQILESDNQTTRSQFNIHNDYPETLSGFVTKEIYNNAKIILGSEPVIYQSHINFKKKSTGGAFAWHSDFCYWNSHDGMQEPRAISVVIPLHNHNSTNGGLSILKGSHRYYYPHTLTTQQSWEMNNVRHDSLEKHKESGLADDASLTFFSSDKITNLDMISGDYAIMDANTWHSSSDNNSHQDRFTLFLVLTSENTKFDSSLLHYRPDFISCRQQIPLSKFL